MRCIGRFLDASRKEMHLLGTLQLYQIAYFLLDLEYAWKEMEL